MHNLASGTMKLIVWSQGLYMLFIVLIFFKYHILFIKVQLVNGAPS